MRIFKRQRTSGTTASGTSVKKGIAYVFVANAINMAISLFTAFVLPKFLSVDTYADIKLFTLYVTYLGILHLGYSDGMYLRNGGKTVAVLDGKEAKTEFSTFKIFQTVVCLLMVVVSLILGNQILLLCSLVILPVNVANYVRNLYNAVGEFKKYSRYTNINTLMIFAINVLLLFIVKSDYYLWYIIGYIVVYFLYWAFIEYELRKVLGKTKRSSRFEKRYMKENVGSGVLLMTGNFCNVIFTSIDRLFVKNLIGMVEFAYYSFAASVENFLNVFITPVSTTMYNYFCREKRKEKIMKVKRYSLLLAAAVAALAFPAKIVIESWLPKYASSIDVLFFLIAAQYAAIIVKIVHINLYKSMKQQKKYFGIMLCVIGISVLLDIVGYLLFRDMIAIAVATLVTNIIWFIIGEIDLRKFAFRVRDYTYFAVNMVAFILCGMCLDAVAGLAVYCLTAVIGALVFERDTCKGLLLVGKRYAGKIVGKKR